MQTAMQKLISQIKEEMTIDTIPKEWYYCLKSVIMSIEVTYLEMEKQQLEKTFDYAVQSEILHKKITAEEYYNETYGSKGSVFLEGYEQIDQNNPVTRGSTALVKVISSKTAISDELSFNKKLENLINIHSMENESNTPDFILAKFMLECLQSFNNAVKHREQLKQRQ